MRIKILCLLFCLSQLVLAQKRAVFSEEEVFFDEDGKEVFRLEEGQQLLSESPIMQGVISSSHYRDIKMQPAYAILNTKNDNVTLLDPFGKKIADLGKKYEIVAPFVEGKAIAYRRMVERPNAFMLSYIDAQGNVLCNGKEFWEAEPFYDGVAIVQLNDEKGDFGYIDENGEMKINLKQRDNIKWNEGTIFPRFKNGVLLDKVFIKKNGQSELKATYLIDKKGNIVKHLEKDLSNLMPWANEKDSSKMGTYAFNREDDGYISLLVDNTKNKGNSTIYLLDEKGQLLTKNTYKTRDFRTVSSSDNSYEYCYYERGLLIKASKLYEPKHINKKEYMDLKGNVLYKLETPFPQDEAKVAGDYKESRINVFDKNHLIFLNINNNLSALDTIILYDLVTKKVVFNVLGSFVNRLSDSLITITCGSRKSSIKTDIKVIYNLNGKKIYETPKEKQAYYFSNVDNLSDFGDLNYRDVYRATFFLGKMNLIASFPNIKRLKIGCNKETILPDDLNKLRHLEYLFINYGNHYYKRMLPESFRNLRKLKHLCISGGRYENLKEILEVIPNLQVIEFQKTNNMSRFPLYWASIEALEKEFPKLQFLYTTAVWQGVPPPDEREETTDTRILQEEIESEDKD
jgi:hypothetical protein